ncbi:uncharacterized protein LOC144326297 [Podarcis muralis]
MGFRIPVAVPPTPREPQNQKSVRDRPDIARKKIEKEIKAGRVAGPFAVPPFEGLHLSPLGIVPKKSPGEFRLIHNLSYPKGGFVNDAIPQELCTVKYASFDQAVKMIRQFGRGALLAKCDIESAFRLLPVHPADFRWLGFKFQGAYFIDKAMPMGCSVACAAFESFSTFLDWALRFRTKSAGVSHYLDDFILVADSKQGCSALLGAFTALSEELGVPLAAEKTEGPATSLIYLGIELDTVAQTSRLPEEKLSALRAVIQQLLPLKKITLRQIQSLLGHLNFAYGALPLISARRGAIIDAFPGASLEYWEQEVMEGLFGAVAPSTLRSYKKSWADFLKFRSSRHNTGPFSIPSTREVLCYLAHLRGLGRAPKTINIQSAGISYFCKAFFNTDPCSAFIVRKTLEGWRRQHPPSVDRRRPITIDILTQIHKKLRAICWSKYEARLFSAAYSIAFFGALRIGEVVCERGADCLQRGILLSDLSLSESELIVQVRSSKTDQLGKGALLRLLAVQGSGPCPVRDTRRFLYLRPRGPSPFLIHADGSPLSRHQFTRVLRTALTACGFPAAEFAAHSFRIGAATTAMHLGLSTERIKDLGRWKSNAYRAYVRKNHDSQ